MITLRSDGLQSGSFFSYGNTYPLCGQFDLSNQTALTAKGVFVMTRRIRLNTGRYTLVSDHRYENLRQHKWCEDDKGYVARSLFPFVDGKRMSVKMHREILGLKRGDKKLSDHINGNRRDNRDENLRVADRHQNGINHKKSSRNKTGYYGVSQHRDGRGFSSGIRFHKNIYLGLFDDPKIAAYAYDNAARKLYGEFAALNFPNIHKSDEWIESHRRKPIRKCL